MRATVASLENDRETRREELAAEIAEAEHQRSETKDGEATAIDERLATLRAEETGLAVKPNEADVTKALLRFEDLWAELFPAERARIVALVIHTITTTPTTANSRSTIAREARQRSYAKPRGNDHEWRRRHLSSEVRRRAENQ